MLGYRDRIQGKGCNLIYFPSTTLYHESKPPDQVLREMDVMCKQLQIDLIRCVVTTLEEWAAIRGEPSE